MDVRRLNRTVSFEDVGQYRKITARLRSRLVGSARGGFTLIEAMLAVMIVGMGIAALMHVFAAGTYVNQYGDRLSKAVFLAEELRSMTDDVAFDDLLAFDGQTFNGVDANGTAVAGLDDFQQSFVVEAVDPDDLTLYVGPDPEAIRLTVNVAFNGDPVTTMSWLRSF